MKLQISYNLTDLPKAINIAEKTVNFTDIIEIGPLLIYKEGVNAVKTFHANFPQKPLFVNAKISEKARESIELFATAGATIVSVSAGIPHATITKATEAAKKIDVKIILDIIDMQTAGQIVLDAKNLGVDAILLHQPPIQTDLYDYTQWQNIVANTNLPIYITGKINRLNILQVKQLHPYCIAVGSAIMKADNPIQEIQYFKSILG